MTTSRPPRPSPVLPSPAGPARRARHPACWVAILGAVVVLAGCTPEADGAQRVAAARQATLAAGTANFTISQAVSGGAQGGQTVQTEGALDFAQGRGRLLVAVPDDGVSGGGEIETVFTTETVYLRLPEAAGAPTPWVRLVLSELQGLPGLEQLQEYSSDPSQTLVFLEGVTGEVEEVGEEEVRGAATTHYRFTVDLGEAVEQADDRTRPFLEQQIETLGVTELPTEVWLDGEGRIARQSYLIDLSASGLPSAQGEGEGGRLDGQVATTIEYFDFGSEVEITEPAEDEVTDFADLLEGAVPEGG